MSRRARKTKNFRLLTTNPDMFDISWMELLVIVGVALVVVGPADVPHVMRRLGLWAGAARRAIHAIQHDIERLSFEAEELARKEEEKGNSQRPFGPPRNDGCEEMVGLGVTEKEERKDDQPS